jgi:DNA-binding CsgD family transcriptional regulator
VKTPNSLERLVRSQQPNTSAVISLMARKGSAQDLANCHALHELLRLPYLETSRRILPEMWRTLLSNGAMQLFLVEDRARPAGSRIVSFNASVFVTDEFCSQARSTLRPYLGIELARRYLSRQLPVLNRERIAAANAGDGLNVVMCFEGWAEDGSASEQTLAIREKQSEAFSLALRGYRIKEFLTDPIGRETSQWMLEAGARLRRDYSNYFRQNSFLEPDPSQRPCLVGLNKEEALLHPGSNIGSLFIYTAPRFHFTRSQRMLLQHALIGQTCEELATSLSLSPWTVKKRWQAIYERVTDVDNELLPPIAYGDRGSSRGAERRRHLLNYLRQHLEELRPYKPPSERRRVVRRHCGFGHTAPPVCPSVSSTPRSSLRRMQRMRFSVPSLAKQAP